MFLNYLKLFSYIIRLKKTTEKNTSSFKTVINLNMYYIIF